MNIYEYNFFEIASYNTRLVYLFFVRLTVCLIKNILLRYILDKIMSSKPQNNAFQKEHKTIPVKATNKLTIIYKKNGSQVRIHHLPSKQK